MIKKIFLLLFLIPIILTSQNVSNLKSIARTSSDTELKNYINKAKNQGISLLEAEQLIKSQGATDDEIMIIRALWNSDIQNLNSTSSEESLPISPESRIENTEQKSSIKISTTKRFGEDFFNNSKITESPQLFLATPLDYRLGPGDELIVNIYGASEKTYSTQISREGNIKFERTEPIYISGLSINQAKSKLKKILSKIYTGINSSSAVEKVDIDLSLKKARSIVVNITGNVEAPGTYTISGFSSILNALYSAGGPSKYGSYRNVSLIRGGKTIEKIDLYKYFSRGEFPSVYLRDQDVIFVPFINKEVEIKGAFNFNGFIELKTTEKFIDLYNLSGGFQSNAFREGVFINRIINNQRELIEIDFDDFLKNKPENGDIIEAYRISEFSIKSIEVKGSVLLPGKFSSKNIFTVSDLIKKAGGLRFDALMSRALLYRRNNGVKDEVISLNLLNSEELNTSVKELDELYIPSKEEIYNSGRINVFGSVKNIGEQVFYEGLNLSDVLISAGGLANNADFNNINIYRNISNENSGFLTKKITVSIDKEINSNDEIELKNNDVIVVNNIQNFQELKTFSVNGDVTLEGFFPLTKEYYTFRDLLDARLFEIKESSDLNAIYIERNGKILPVDINKSGNIEIIENDRIYFPKKISTIEVLGEVNNSVILNYYDVKNVKQAIKRSGGLTKLSDKKSIYVTYPNGLSSSTRKFLFFNFYPKLKPGSKLYIPKEIEKDKVNSGDLLAVATSLTSIVALINIISK